MLLGFLCLTLFFIVALVMCLGALMLFDAIANAIVCTPSFHRASRQTNAVMPTDTGHHSHRLLPMYEKSTIIPAA